MQAIKKLKEETEIGIKEAKEYVDNLEIKLSSEF